MTRKVLLPLALCLCCGCVATQNVPVSTNPSGAVVFLDGKKVCETTPCSVAVTKDQDHLLTLIRPGYHQKDLPVRRVYDAAGALRDSAIVGVQAAAGGAEAAEVLAGTVNRADKRERDGTAYVLEPSLVTVRLIPESEPLPPEPRPGNGRGAGNRQGMGMDPVTLGLEMLRILEGDGK